VLKNNLLGLIKWEQMVYLGNPQYGVEMAPFDFVKFAEAAGGRGVRITDPARCRDQLAEALALDGPVVVEAIVDANEPPMPANVKPVQAAHLAEALVRGEPNRQRIGLTLFRDVVDETTFAAAPSGVVARVMEKAAKVAGNGKGDKEEQGGKH
jgi:pyruvate dehydrogenase (quinone)